MSAGEPRVLGEVGGLVVAERGALVLVVDRRSGPPAVLAFVAGVVALVFGGFGAVSLMVIANGTRPHVLLRGNPFTGGLGDLDIVLTSAVHAPPR